MAFGKDSTVMGAVGSFRQTTGQYHQPRSDKKSGGGSKGVPNFVGKYSPSEFSIDDIRILRGKYVQDEMVGEGDNVTTKQVVKNYIKFTEHFDGVKMKSAICSAGALGGIKNKRNPCHGCDMFWATAGRSTGRFESTRISRVEKTAFSIFDYGAYHHIEARDKDGNVKVNNQTKQPYLNWEKCEGQGCTGCREGKETKYGDNRHWVLNNSQLEVLRDGDPLIGTACKTCRTANSIVSRSWVCQGCGNDAINVQTTDLKPKDLSAITDKPYKCECGHTGFLEELVGCQVCSKTGAIPARATIYDVDLRIKAIPNPNPNAKGKSIQLMGWSLPGSPPEQFIEFMEPLDLPAIYAPDSMATQISKFGDLPVKREPATGAAGTAAPSGAARPYGSSTPYGSK